MNERSHTIGEVFAYFRWRITNCALLGRCWACDVEWNWLQEKAQSDEERA